MLDTSLPSLSALAVDDSAGRVYLASKAANTVLAMDFSGNQVAVRSSLAQPSALAVGDGNVYALLSGTGQVVRLDPVTLQPTVVAGGLIEAGGLAFTNGALYTVAKSGGSPKLLRIAPANGALTDPGFAPTESAGVLYASPRRPGSLYMMRQLGYSPGGLFRFDLATLATNYKHETPEQFEILPDGHLVTGSGISDKPGGLLARDGESMELSGRRWLMSNTQYQPAAWGASAQAIAIARYDIVEVRSLFQTGDSFRSFQLLNNYYVTRGGVAMSADS